MDSITLPERSRHDPESRRQRQRRSAAQLPALVAAVDIPEEAEGRVEFVVVRAATSREEPAAAEASPSAPRRDFVRDVLTLGSGWVAVAVLAAVLIVVFIGLDVLYR